MEVDQQLDLLVQCTTLAPESALVRRLRAEGTDAGLDGEAATRLRANALAAAAAAILDLPWRRALPLELLAELEQLVGERRSALDHVAGFLRAGCGRNAVERVEGGAAWLPVWMVEEAERRSGEKIDDLAERWAIPPGWPVPTRQSCVALIPSLAQLDVDHFRNVVVGEHVVVEEAEYPQEWWRQSSGGLTRAVRAVLLVLDPSAGMRALLSVPGEPLLGIAHEIALLALRERHWLAEQGRSWQGQWSANTVIGRMDEHVVLEQGWLGHILRGLGIDCLGMGGATTITAERLTIARSGGRILRLQGGGELHCLPPAAGGLIAALDVNWEHVPRLG